jgi:hypothetical protein
VLARSRFGTILFIRIRKALRTIGFRKCHHKRRAIMARQKRFRGDQIVTTLTSSDYVRFSQVCQSRQISLSTLAREAIVAYLDRMQSAETEEVEAEYVRTMKSCTNRICAMISKVAIDTRAIFRFLGDLEDEGPDRMLECRAAAARQISQALTASERAVAESMSAVIKPPVRSDGDGAAHDNQA